MCGRKEGDPAGSLREVTVPPPGSVSATAQTWKVHAASHLPLQRPPPARHLPPCDPPRPHAFHWGEAAALPPLSDTRGTQSPGPFEFSPFGEPAGSPNAHGLTGANKLRDVFSSPAFPKINKGPNKQISAAAGAAGLSPLLLPRGAPRAPDAVKGGHGRPQVPATADPAAVLAQLHRTVRSERFLRSETRTQGRGPTAQGSPGGLLGLRAGHASASRAPPSSGPPTRGVCSPPPPVVDKQAEAQRR